MAREYSEAEAAHALAVLKANRGNAKKTALQVGVPRTTLRQWANRAVTTTGSPKKVSESAQTEAQSELATKWRKVADVSIDKALAALEHLDPSDMSASDTYSTIKGAGVATDKDQLLSGNPTSRTEQSRLVYVIGNPLRDAALVAIGRTDPGTTPALEGEFVVRPDMSNALVVKPLTNGTAD